MGGVRVVEGMVGVGVMGGGGGLGGGGDVWAKVLAPALPWRQPGGAMRADGPRRSVRMARDPLMMVPSITGTRGGRGGRLYLIMARADASLHTDDMMAAR